MIAVLLMGFGSPDSLESIEPFLANLMGGKKPSAQQLEKVKERYKLIGGKSPLLEITEEQARKLEASLNKGGDKYKLYVGMRYWHPYISEMVKAIAQDGIKHLAALSLSPFSSRVTTGAYLNDLKEAIPQGSKLEFAFIDGWFKHPLFIDALVEKVREGMANFSSEEQSEIDLVFSAHSLPKEYIAAGDPYVDEIEETISLIIEKLGGIPWHLGYQSKGVAGGEWLEPEVEVLLSQLAREGRKKVLLVPIGFVADHVETLYDIDISLREKAEALGLAFHRAPSLNASPKFIEALTQIIEERVKNWEA